jgi:photosystem II stability/assembly factor-like uncharacterized protein
MQMRSLTILGLMLVATTVLAQDPPLTSNAARRAQYVDAMRQFPFGEVPLHATRREYLARLRANGALFERDDGSTWVQIGPAPIGTVDAGRVAAVVIHPRDRNVIYVGAAQGGIWKSTTGGTTWRPLTDDQCSLATGSIALDPLDPDVLYVGTGEQTYSGSSYYGCGVLKSTDGGASWTQLGGSLFDTNTGGAKIGTLRVVPGVSPATRSSTVLLASTFGVYRSMDAGVTWTKSTIAANENSQATDLLVDPRDARVVLAAFTSTGSHVANSIYRSTDGGVTFPERTAGLPTTNVGRIRLAYAPSNPDTVYAAIHAPSTAALLGIWRSIDAGSTWSQLSATGASCGTQCWYDMYLAVDPSDSRRVFFGGVSLYRSQDAGATFQQIGSSIHGGFIHVDHHAMAFDPADPARLIAASDGGVYESLDRGGTFRSLNTTLAITQFYRGLSIGVPGPSQLLGGTQDNGTGARTGDLAWVRVLGGDGGYTAIHPVTGTAYAETQWVANQGYTGPRRAASLMGPFNLIRNGIVTTDPGLFIPPLVMDRVRPHTLYFGTARLYRTRDGGDLWTELHRLGVGSVSAIAPAPTDSLVIYIGSSAGDVRVSRDGGVTWPQRSSGLPSRHVSDIVVHRGDPDIAFLSVSGFGSAHVFKTVDAGVTWVSINGNLPDLPVSGLELLPDGSLIAATDLGVYRTRDGGVAWQRQGVGLPNVAVFDAVYHAPTSTLVAATHGRSMFAATVTAELVPAALSVVVGPPPRIASGLSFPLSARVTGAAGDPVDAAAEVTLRVAEGNAVLSGSITTTAAGGLASFDAVSLRGSGTVRLELTAPGLPARPLAPITLVNLVGDVSGDGRITADDASDILRFVVGAAGELSGRITAVGDANCDGVINAVDAAIIRAFAAGRDVSRFCVGRVLPPS